jgi:glycosyltransferase involved in cell wall biosynthesis
VALGPGTRPRKIAYIKRGLFSYSNHRTGEQLRRHFPEFEVEEIDVVNDLLRKHKAIILINVLCIFLQYWRELLSRRQTVRLCFYRTPYIFRKIRELVRQRLKPHLSEYAFSIQTQSLYDASVASLPHFVYTDHTHLTNLQYPGFPRAELFSRKWIDLEQEIYRNAKHVFVMSEHVRRSLIDQYGCDPADSTCVYAGSNIDPTPVPLQNDNYQNQTVVFVGVDWERKGGRTLVKAFKQVLETLPKARLVIIGSSPSVRHAQIEVVGRASHEEVKARLIKASVFCLPTRVEPFGIAVVEAFFHKLPVITTTIGAMPDLVRAGESGLLVPPDDPSALAAALIELLRDPAKCRRFGERGNEVVLSRYSWNEVGRKLRAGIDASLAGEKLAAA